MTFNMNCCWLGWMTGTGKVAGHSDHFRLRQPESLFHLSNRSEPTSWQENTSWPMTFESVKPRCMGFNLEGGQYVQEQRHGVILLILSRVRLRLLVNHWNIPNQYKQKDSVELVAHQCFYDAFAIILTLACSSLFGRKKSRGWIYFASTASACGLEGVMEKSWVLCFRRNFVQHLFHGELTTFLRCTEETSRFWILVPDGYI